jgi:hypothetical protein
MFCIHAMPVAPERNPTTTRAGTVFQTCNAGRAGAQPYPTARTGTVLQTCNAGRAGAQPYPPRAQGTPFQTCNAGRAGAQPYHHARRNGFPDVQPRSRRSATLPATRTANAFSRRTTLPAYVNVLQTCDTPIRRYADTSPPTSVTGSVTYDRYFL